MKIGVSGSNGQLGKAVLARLLDLKGSHELVAITRSPETIKPKIGSRYADYDQPSSLLEAYAGLDRLLIIPSPDLRPGVRSAQAAAAVDAAIKAGVGHVFLMSATGTRQRIDPAMGAAYWIAEQGLIKNASTPWTILRANYFSETLAEQAGMAAETGHLPGLKENYVAFVSREDVANAAAHALVGDGHEGAIYSLSGPERISGAQRADLLSDHTTKPVAFAVMPEAAIRGAMDASGVPTFVIDAVLSMQLAQAEGDYDILTGDIEALTGVPPRSLREVLADIGRRSPSTINADQDD